MRLLLACGLIAGILVMVAVRSAETGQVQTPAPTPTVSAPVYDLRFDLNGDGYINALDFAILGKHFLARRDTPTAVSTATNNAVPTATSTPSARNFLTWPFGSTSIRNMPIGSPAVYLPAGIQNANAWYGEITTDDEFIGLSPLDPLRLISGHLVHVPPLMHHDGGYNGSAAFLQDDNRHVSQGQPLTLSTGGTPSWTYDAPTVDIQGDGILGAHGGSGLSSFGGSIRKGELSGAAPLHHALKINLSAKRFLSCASGGYRWPAVKADSYMSCTTYGGSVPALRMGSLVALPPSEGCLLYASNHAYKLCRALQDYGAYVADDTYWDVHAIDVESVAEFSDGGSFHTDLQAIFTHLAVVDNNGPGNVGGGGTPRAPLAP